MSDPGFKHLNILTDIHVHVTKWCWMYAGKIISHKQSIFITLLIKKSLTRKETTAPLSIMDHLPPKTKKTNTPVDGANCKSKQWKVIWC